MQTEGSVLLRTLSFSVPASKYYRHQITFSVEDFMSTVSISKLAPDFSLEDTSGKTVSLSDYYGSKNVVLIFNRGFV
jgi:hypothetical protein